jgi:hypothetical protein
MKVSVNAVWDETLAFIRAERGLVVPLALGTLYLSSVLVIAASALPQVLLAPLILIGAAWYVVGQFALIDLALFPGRSVREAIGVGVRRLPPAILIYLLVGAAFVLLAAPLGVALMQAGYAPETWQKLFANQLAVVKALNELPGWANLYFTVAVFGACYLFVRLLLWKAALVAGAQPIDAFKQSWTLTRGRFWVLVGLSLLAGLVMELVSWALESALGAIFLLAGRSLGSAVVGLIVPALLVALVSTAFQTVITLFLARFYKRAAA